MKRLITGTGSGLGQFLLQTDGGTPWDRGRDSSSESNPDVIIHGAWPARPPQDERGLAEYWSGTLGLTKRLTDWPHRKFIFISTAEVYPVSGHSGSEGDPIELSHLRNFYGSCKLLAESIVQAHARRPLILRVVGLLGDSARPSSVIRILRGDADALTLTPESRFYYVLHRDVGAFIRTAIEREYEGIYNVCPSDSVTLGEIAKKFGRTVRWGGYTYDVGHVDNRKIAAVCPTFKKTSLEVIEEFAASARTLPPRV